MGSLFQATCQCGFSAGGLLLGGGMSNFKTFCGAPAFCASCGSFQVLNYFDKHPPCGHCGEPARFYDDPQLCAASDDAERQRLRRVFSWNLPDTFSLDPRRRRGGTFVLLDAGYLCPACRQMTLRFSPAAMWD